MDASVEEVLKSESIHSSTKTLHKILDAKYEKADLNKVTNEKFHIFLHVSYCAYLACISSPLIDFTNRLRPTTLILVYSEPF